MRELIALELRRHRLRPYHTAALLCGVTMLAFQSLLAAIPYMDPAEPDAALFSSYPFLMGVTSVVCMALFAILSAVMAARFVVEEYRGKRAILLLAYPIPRRKVLLAKLILVLLYPTAAMVLCGAGLQAVFLAVRALFPLGGDRLTLGTILGAAGFLFGCALLAGMLGLLSLWVGFRRRSVAGTIVAAGFLACLVCQVVSVALAVCPVLWLTLGAAAACSLLAAKDLFGRVEELEV